MGVMVSLGRSVRVGLGVFVFVGGMDVAVCVAVFVGPRVGTVWNAGAPQERFSGTRIESVRVTRSKIKRVYGGF